MMIDTRQLIEKLEDAFKNCNSETMKELIAFDLWRVERMEELFKKYFGGDNEKIQT
jgi:hypothetical protein